MRAYHNVPLLHPFYERTSYRVGPGATAERLELPVAKDGHQDIQIVNAIEALERITQIE